jgi:hypothetical protein
MSLFTINTKKIILLSAILLIISLFYFFFLNEYIDYVSIKNEPTLAKIYEYYEKYPNGYFTEDVNFIELSLSDDIEKIRHFLDKYPGSTYAEEVKENSRRLWTEEINKYIKYIKSVPNTDPDAVKFFIELLYYMRDNYTKTIHMYLHGNVNLKEFVDYDISSQEVLLKDIKKDAWAAPLKENLVPLESVYQTGHIKNLEEILRKALTKSFENILKANFIEVVSTEESKNANLKIEIYYKIGNEELEISGIKTPALWEYWKYNNFIAYLMGITIDFNFEFTIPNSNNIYSFMQNTNPGDFIRDIGNIKNGYILMTKMSFQNYANEIIKLFGLKKNSGAEIIKYSSKQ